MHSKSATHGHSTSNRGVPPHHLWDDDWLALRVEDVIEPDRPVIDAHHHLWCIHQPYFADELAEDLNSGHMVRGTVYVEATSMYRDGGDPSFKTVGEVEFANGVAAMYASGYYGNVQACAGIVGKVDLTLGAMAADVLHACISRAPGRFKGVRHMAGWDASPAVNTLRQPPPKNLFRDPQFREGLATLAPLGLSFDAQCYHPQLPQVVELADLFPDTNFVVNHLGTFARIGPYRKNLDEQFARWKADLAALAQRPNVMMKIGGLSMRVFGFDFIDRDVPPSSEELADAWRPLVETCIELFGPDRVMFESNFPVDRAGVSYRVLWNAYKRIVANYADDEKHQMFAGTAIRTYRLPRALGEPVTEIQT